MQKVHPRACGEHTVDEPSVATESGSSPRLRGTLRRQAGQLGPSRFIPAPAGNIPASLGRFALPAVHPRACGEHCSQSNSRCTYTGSSPRLRGTYLNQDSVHPQKRFIPAPAGNMPISPAALDLSLVHPRACGEHAERGNTFSKSVGSSPRLRGTCLSITWRCGNGRFIPAPAGNISKRRSAVARKTVHPRACGEHWLGQ